MSRDWDKTTKGWADTIEGTDEARGSGARDAIETAVRAAFAQKRIDVFVTGSYRNNTNIRSDSDIDVAVALHDVIFHTVPEGSSLTKEMLGLKDSDYTFDAWRTDVGAALRKHFVKCHVTDGNKAFNVRAAGDKLEADVVVFFEHRRYTGKKRSDGAWEYHEGVEMLPRNDPAKRIVNWPQQHYDRGIAKNDETNRRYKRMVRILKHLAVDMATQGNDEQKSGAGQVTSFFLECLVHQVPNDRFNLETGGYLKDTRAALTWLGNATKPKADASKFLEVSGLEWLFRSATGRTQAQAYAFVQAAWGRITEGEKLPW